MFGQPATAPAGTSLFGNKPAGTGLFGATPGSTPSLFGSTAKPAAFPSPNTGLFGAKPAAPAGMGLFGAKPAAPASTGLFGAAPAAAGSTGLFGAAPAAAASTGLFGAKPAAAASTGLFGAKPAAPASTGLFGAKPATPATGGLFGGQAPSTAATSMFGAPSAVGVGGFATGVNTAAAGGAWPFAGAHGLLQHPNAQELVVDFPATNATSVPPGQVPEPLRGELLKHQINVDRQGRALTEGMQRSDADMNQLFSHTSTFRESVLELRSKLEQQRNAVVSLVSEARGCGQEAEKALREARRLGQRAPVHYTLRTAVPSDFFWRLLERLQDRLKLYMSRTEEMYNIVRPLRADGSSQRHLMQQQQSETSHKQPQVSVADLVSIMHEQHEAFLSVAAAVAVIHERVDELREQYQLWRASTGNPHHDIFERADNIERERQKRALRKVEESAHEIPSSSAGSAAQQQLTNTGAPTGAAPASQMLAPSSIKPLFGTGPSYGGASTAPSAVTSTFATPSTSLFAPAVSGGGLFGAAAKPAAPTFGAAPAVAFGNPAAMGTAFGTPAATGGAFPTAGAGVAAPAPPANRRKGKSRKSRSGR